MSDNIDNNTDEELPSEDLIGEDIPEGENNENPIVDSSTNDAIYQERSAFSQTMKSLINSLPAKYNKETSDTNYYKLLRGLAHELKNSKIEVKKLGDDRYLETVSPERIFDNFGTLVKLKKDPEWDSEKYRRLVKGVIQSLLKGPTKQSLIEGLNLFTDFKVNVYELYKKADRDKVDPSLFNNVDWQFSFILEIEKPVDSFADQSSLIRDANYIVNIIKPAHTISIIITTIIGEESYRQYYRDKYNIDDLESQLTNTELPDYYGMDKMSAEASIKHTDNIYGYKYKGDGIFGTNSSLIGGNDLIGPVYDLKDLRDWHFEQQSKENYFQNNWELGYSDLNQQELELRKRNNHLDEIGYGYSEKIDTVDEIITSSQLDLSVSYRSLLDTIHERLKEAHSENSVDYIEDQYYVEKEEINSILNYDLHETGRDFIDHTHDHYNVDLGNADDYDTISITDEVQQVWLQAVHEENYSILVNRGRFFLSSTKLGSRLNGPDFISGTTTDEASEFATRYNEVYEGINVKNTFTMEIEKENSETYNIVNIEEEILQVFEDQLYTNNHIVDDVSGHGVGFSDKFNAHLIKDQYKQSASLNNQENYKLKKEELTNGFDNKETLPMMYVENIPRFILNTTPLNSSRLGGVIRDQVTMVAS